AVRPVLIAIPSLEQIVLSPTMAKTRNARAITNKTTTFDGDKARDRNPHDRRRASNQRTVVTTTPVETTTTTMSRSSVTTTTTETRDGVVISTTTTTVRSSEK
ncbi:hypothetical protein FOZ62_022327, partial [Perkinsus olseni]